MPVEILAVTVGAAVWAILSYPLIQNALKELMHVALATFVAEKGLDSENTNAAVTAYLNEHARSIGRGLEVVGAERAHIRPIGKTKTIFVRVNDRGWQLFMYRGRPLLYTKTIKGGTTARLYFLRHTLNWDKFLLQAADYCDEARQKRQKTSGFAVVHYSGTEASVATSPWEDKDDGIDERVGSTFWYRPPVGWDPKDIGPPMPENFLEFLSLGREARQVVRDVKFWYNNREWYRERGVPWRRGVLLHGKPGNGKTSLVRALAQHLDIPVHVFDLASMDNDDLIRHWDTARSSGDQRIVLLEDIDAVFHGRDNAIEHSELTFDTLLNCIDGIEQEDGLLLFVTTNLVEHIDPALGQPTGDGGTTRPGRLDLAVELPGLDYDGRFKMALRITKDEDVARELAQHEEGTAVQFQERCVRWALEQLWEGKDA